jgi:hypothetical protein
LVSTSTSSPKRSTERRGVRIELVGFTAKRATTGLAGADAARMPAAWLEPNSTSPPAHAHLVGILLPVRAAAAKPRRSQRPSRH